MRTSKKQQQEVMESQVRLAQLQINKVMATINTLMKMDATEWRPGWSSGLYERRIDMMNAQIWMQGWLDAIKQKS